MASKRILYLTKDNYQSRENGCNIKMWIATTLTSVTMCNMAIQLNTYVPSDMLT
jgi:hypothetical protein